MHSHLSSAYLAIVFLWSISVSAQTPPTTKIGGITFHPYQIVANSGVSIGAEIGRIIVPENRAKPKGNVVELSFVRIKSTAQKPAPPIIYLAGGPGANAIRGTLTGDRFPLFLALRELGDVIVLDQRGTGMSKPSLTTTATFGIPLEKSLESPEVQKIMVDNARAFATSLRQQGIDISAYNTVENADDVNDLRIALGLEKINLWGHSYGSHLGLAILKRHEKYIHRAALSGVNGLDQRYRLPTGADTVFKRIDECIAQNAKLRTAIPDFRALVNGVINNLAAKPATADITLRGKKITVEIGKYDIQVLTMLLLGEKSFIAEMPSLYYAMSKGDFTRAAEMIVGGLKMRQMGTGMTYSMHCASGVTAAKWQKILQSAPTALMGNAINFPFALPEFCAAWNIQDLGDNFRAAVQTNVPTLLMSSTLDGRTSIAEAQEVRSGLKNCTHVVFENIAHDLDVPEALTIMKEFFMEKPITQTRIVVPNFELYSLNTASIIDALYKTIMEKGAQAFDAEFTALVNADAYINSTITLLVGNRLVREKKIAEAIAVWETNTRIFPNRWQIHSALGEAYSTLGNKERAVSHFRRALELNPFHLFAQEQLTKLQQ